MTSSSQRQIHWLRGGHYSSSVSDFRGKDFGKGDTVNYEPSPGLTANLSRGAGEGALTPALPGVVAALVCAAGL